MEFSTATLGWLAIAAIAAAVAAAALGIAALLGQARVRKAYSMFSMGSRDDVLTLLQRHIDEVRRLRTDVGGLHDYAEELRRLISERVSNVAAVRYDAFEEMGGHLSFSAALLDEHGDGIVLTSINGRTDTRTYAKPVVSGNSRHNLSDEEKQAIHQAMAPERAGRRLAAGGGAIPRAS
ncbi:MAG TPA: DUF4446 family protein [Egibacteraceae bacterium]|nr:DUF4446 family protein [Egibacteraceae bacterium]